MSDALKHSDILYSIFWVGLIGILIFLLYRIELNTENLIKIIKKEK